MGRFYLRIYLLLLIVFLLFWTIILFFLPNYKSKPDTASHLISIYFYPEAGLGNQMFAYASLISIASINKFIPIIPTDLLINQVFHLNALLDWYNYIDNSFIEFKEKGAVIYDPRTQNLPQANIFLRGYYQSWKYFDQYEDDIRLEFIFEDDIHTKAQTILKTALEKWPQDLSTVIGIHVRRGDVLNSLNVNFGFRVAPLHYINKAMKYFKTKYPKSVFLVCSNDHKWSRKNIKGKDVTFVDSHSAAIDMAVLTQCNHTIITVGSFGWWSAYLAGGEVVYYTDWQAPNSEFANQTSNNDYFPQHWIGMS